MILNQSWHNLRVGDHIRIKQVPEVKMLADTLHLYQRLVKERAVLRVYQIAATGHPVIEYSFKNERGEWEAHALTIDEFDVWERVNLR